MKYEDTDLGSFCQKEAQSELCMPPRPSPELGPRLPPRFHCNQEAKPPTVPLQPPSASDEQEVLAVKQKTIEQIVLDVWDKNKELLISKGAGFRKDFTIKVLERLVPPESERLYHDYYSPTNDQNRPDETNDSKGKGEAL